MINTSHSTNTSHGGPNGASANCSQKHKSPELLLGKPSSPSGLCSSVRPTGEPSRRPTLRTLPWGSRPKAPESQSHSDRKARGLRSLFARSINPVPEGQGNVGCVLCSTSARRRLRTTSASRTPMNSGRNRHAGPGTIATRMSLSQLNLIQRPYMRRALFPLVPSRVDDAATASRWVLCEVAPPAVVAGV